jgi:L-2-hydroxyglutarate oxidase LhgO
MPVYDLAVIGAGIVGLGAAREMLRRHPDFRVAVIDKEQTVAAHQTGHNSGVIHSGIYYAPGSLKARLCTEGRREMYAYCEQKGIPTERCGKVIIALDETEVPRLMSLWERGQSNGVPGIELIDRERIKELEPYCTGFQGIWSPETGIVDYSLVAAAYADDIRESGGEFRFGHEVTGFGHAYSSELILTSKGTVEARRVLVCAGLYADRIARMAGESDDPRIVPFRGDYWTIRPERSYLTKNMIYPVPDPRFPFLGVHFTRRIADGSIWLGPNAVLAFAREGYGRLTTSPGELMESLSFSGFRKVAMKYWRMGAQEMARDFSKHLFLESLQKYVPEITSDDLLPGSSGVRAQALDRDGSLVDDFVFNTQGERVIHVRNAPSPAATSSLAIARLIADTADKAFGLTA